MVKGKNKQTTKKKATPAPEPTPKAVVKIPPLQVQLDDHAARIAKLEAQLK